MSNENRAPQAYRAQGTVLLASTVDMSNVFLDGIVQELSDRHWNVHTVSSPGPVATRLFGCTATVHSLPMERRPSPLRDLRSLRRWLRLLSQVRPDVLVLGTPKASLLGGLAGRIMRVPHILYVIHGLRAEQSRGMGGRLLEGVERLSIRLADNVLAVSPSLRREVELAHPRLPIRVEVLGFGSLNGVDINRFAPPSDAQRATARKELGLPRGPVAAFVGRFERDKGGAFLLALMQEESIRELDLHLLVVGDIEDESLLPGIEALSSEGRLTITGWVADPESVMVATDILLHPTRREGLGTALLEAQAMGIPVVTNRVTGTEDAVHSGVGGHFAEIDSLRSWADLIVALAADEEARRVLGEGGRSFVFERYERTKVVARFADYVDDMSRGGHSVTKPKRPVKGEPK